jgi:hypothetical protein
MLGGQRALSSREVDRRVIICTMAAKNTTFSTALLGGLDEKMHINLLGECLTHNSA